MTDLLGNLFMVLGICAFVFCIAGTLGAIKKSGQLSREEEREELDRIFHVPEVR
jgi:hypothetical protein